MASSSIRSSKSGSGDKRRGLLGPAFYRRDTLEVARDLLGKVLLVRRPGSRIPSTVRIVETEAYQGDDPASHSARGHTPRSSVMFGPPGRAYVYFIYGMYEMLNFVTEPEGKAGAVLIRAGEPLLGEKAMFARRPRVRNRLELARGPGKLCRALGIEMSDNGRSLEGPWLEVHDDGFRVDSVSASPRVGISAATDRMWRFFLTDSPFVSRSPQNARSILLSGIPAGGRK